MSREPCVPRIVRQYEPDPERQLQALDMVLHALAAVRTGARGISRPQRGEITFVTSNPMFPVSDSMEGCNEHEDSE